MNPRTLDSAAPSIAARQRGVALIVALVLLIIITLIGLASIRGTTMQEKMAGNLNDRNIALQNAEAAIRVATARLATTTADVWRDCSLASVTCDADPSTAADAANAWRTVATGSSATQYTAGATAAGQPQYVVENMGLWPDPNSNTGANLSGGAGQYGAQGTSTTVNYYRITARSSDPTATQDRAVVTLQVWVKQ